MEVHERREFTACPSPCPASGGVDRRFASADIVACVRHSLHWKFNVMGFEAEYFKQLYVFLYEGKCLAHFFPSRRALSRFQLSEHKGHLSILVKFSRCLFWMDGFEEEQFVMLALPPANCTKSQPLQIHYRPFPWRSCSSQDRMNGLGDFRSEPKVKPDW